MARPNPSREVRNPSEGSEHDRGDDARRRAIRDILTSGAAAHRPIASQAELRRRLGARGIPASQATLSRDMALLGVRRAAGADGPRYLIEADGESLPLEPVRRLVDGVESNGAMVVVRTKASTAMAVARALDEAGLEEVMGTIAGDDTIFVAPRRARDGDAVARKLRAVLGLG